MQILPSVTRTSPASGWNPPAAVAAPTPQRCPPGRHRSERPVNHRSHLCPIEQTCRFTTCSKRGPRGVTHGHPGPGSASTGPIPRGAKWHWRGRKAGSSGNEGDERLVDGQWHVRWGHRRLRTSASDRRSTTRRGRFNRGQPMRRLTVLLCTAIWCTAGMASRRWSHFGVSVTVVHLVVTRTEAGTVTTTCDKSPCISPTVTLGPVDPKAGIRYVTITY